MLRTEKEVLGGGERKASFCLPRRPGEKEKRRRKGGGDRHQKETFVMLNKGDCLIFVTTLIFVVALFCIFLCLLHSTVQPVTEIIPQKACNSLYLYVCVTLHLVSLSRSFCVHYVGYRTNSTATFAKIF